MTRAASAYAHSGNYEIMSATTTTLIDLTIDGKAVRVPQGTSVFDAARMNGIAIPTLCHLQNETPVGVCRLCVVDTGARVMAASGRASCRARHEGGHRLRQSSRSAQNSFRTFDVGSSVSLRKATAFG